MKKSTTASTASTTVERVEPTSVEYLSATTVENMANLPARATQIKVITTDDQLRQASAIDAQLADTIKGIEEDLKDGKNKAYAAWKWFTKRETDAIAPLQAARRYLSGLVTACLSERQRKANEEARLLQVAQAEQARLEAEAVRETRIEVLAAEGRVDEAAELMVEDLVVENVARITIAPIAPQGLGMSLTSRWSSELVDIKKLCRAVAAGEVEPNCVMMDQKYMDGQARLKKVTFDYPGVKVVETKGTSR